MTFCGLTVSILFNFCFRHTLVLPVLSSYLSPISQTWSAKLYTVWCWFESTVLLHNNACFMKRLTTVSSFVLLPFHLSITDRISLLSPAHNVPCFPVSFKTFHFVNFCTTGLTATPKCNAFPVKRGGNCARQLCNPISPSYLCGWRWIQMQTRKRGLTKMYFFYYFREADVQKENDNKVYKSKQETYKGK